jgi:hypothetical protein
MHYILYAWKIHTQANLWSLVRMKRMRNKLLVWMSQKRNASFRLHVWTFCIYCVNGSRPHAKKSASLRGKNNAGHLSTADEPLSEFIIKWPFWLSYDSSRYTYFYIFQVSWPYECRHASILHFSGDYQFIFPIYDCCSKCSFPQFTSCVAKSRSKNSPEWMCPSEGLQCIVGCVNKHKPGGTCGILYRTGRIILPHGVLKPGCEKPETENGKQCIRKLCVPLGQAFKPWLKECEVFVLSGINGTGRHWYYINACLKAIYHVQKRIWFDLTRIN